MGSSQLETFVHYEFIAGGIVWLVFFTPLLFILAWEHHKKKRYPQDLIMFLFFLSAFTRSLWYFLYWDYGTLIGIVIMNRLAILLQFSAISMLALMWIRAIKILPNRLQSLSSASNDRDIYSYFDLMQQRFLNIQRITLFINLVAWVIVLGSLAKDNSVYYSFNILALSALFDAVAFVILVAGIITAFQLKQNVCPDKSNVRDVSTNICACILSTILYSFKMPYQLVTFLLSKNDDRGVLLQKRVMGQLLLNAWLMSIIYVIRSLMFYYGDVLKDEAGIVIDYICYPWFFYQVPEFVPVILIAISISPPNGILRRIFKRKNKKAATSAAGTSFSQTTNESTVNNALRSDSNATIEMTRPTSQSISDFESFAYNDDVRFAGSVVGSSPMMSAATLSSLSTNSNPMNMSNPSMISNRATTATLSHITEDELNEFLYKTFSFTPN